MFDLPQAKRVRRDELHSPRSTLSPSPDAELAQLIQSRLAHIYGDASTIETVVATQEGLPTSAPAPEHEDEGFEFRLFASAASKSTARGPIALSGNPISEAGGRDEDTIMLDEHAGKRDTMTRIILREDTAAEGEGGFVVPIRNKSYYFADPAEGALKASFEAAAVSGEDVMKHLKDRYWGMEVPWKVRVLRIMCSNKNVSPTSDGERRIEGVMVGEKMKRRKAGKKRRIILRTRARKAIGDKEQREKKQKEKEEADREKRTRRNREKKVKKRLREKAKKAQTGDAEEAGDSAHSDTD